MKCYNCGNEIPDGRDYCPVCGQSLIVNGQANELKVWTVFGKLSKIFGIVSIATCWIPILLSWGFAIPAIVFGILASKKSKNEETISNGKTGKILSIIALIVSLLVYIIFLVVVMVMNFTTIYELLDRYGLVVHF